MSPATIFSLHLCLGYVAWTLCFMTYAWPRLKAMEAARAQRAIATLHGFRFFGLAFLLPGVVGTQLPAGFATFAAYGDLATGVLALLALVAYGNRRLFWLFTVAFNVVGIVDLIVDYFHGVTLGLPARAGELGATYAIPIVYVPLLMLTHCAAFYLMASRHRPEAVPSIAREPALD
jgi:hypothetical protein